MQTGLAERHAAPLTVVNVGDCHYRRLHIVRMERPGTVSYCGRASQCCNSKPCRQHVHEWLLSMRGRGSALKYCRQAAAASCPGMHILRCCHEAASSAHRAANPVVPQLPGGAVALLLSRPPHSRAAGVVRGTRGRAVGMAIVLWDSEPACTVSGAALDRAAA